MMIPPKGACLSVAKALSQAFAQVRVGADAARVGVLENRHRRLGELRDQRRRRGDVEDVVVGEFLAVKLFKIGSEVAVKFGGLVRIFAVAEPQFEGQVEPEGGEWFPVPG